MTVPLSEIDATPFGRAQAAIGYASMLERRMRLAFNDRRYGDCANLARDLKDACEIVERRVMGAAR